MVFTQLFVCLQTLTTAFERRLMPVMSPRNLIMVPLSI